jgi:hypothetical protein
MNNDEGKKGMSPINDTQLNIGLLPFFRPKRITAMNHRWIICTLLLCAGAAISAGEEPTRLKTSSGVGAEERPDDFGRQWVRSHPFTLMALTLQGKSVGDNDRYAEAGFSNMLAWKNKPEIFQAAVRRNLPWHYHLDKRIEDLDVVKSQVDRLLKSYPGGQGFLAWDEPKLPDMPRAAERVAWLKQVYPELLVYSTVNPIKPPFEFSFPNLAGEKVIAEGLYDEPPVPYTYDDHLDNLAQIVKSDVLMGNIYPFWVPEKLNPEKYLRNQFFFMLMAFRKAGLKHNRPYWIFVQCYEHPGRCRYPSESDVRMEVYSALAFGFTGVSYFLYDSAPPFGPGMLNHDFSLAPLYHQVKALNAEVARLGQSLRFLTSTDVRYLPGNRLERETPVKNPVPRPLAAFHPRSRVAKHVRDAEFGGTGPHNDGLIGFFRDDAGGKYVMVVNLQHGLGQSAEAARARVDLTLDSSIKAVYRLSRETGKVESIPVVAAKLHLDLPGGTGELLKLNDGDFAGLKRFPSNLE